MHPRLVGKKGVVRTTMIALFDPVTVLPVAAPQDFCPDDEIMRNFATAKGVVTAIRQIADLLTGFRSLHWIEPSFILLSIKD